jgi:hypothetical protein
MGVALTGKRARHDTLEMIIPVPQEILEGVVVCCTVAHVALELFLSDKGTRTEEPAFVRIYGRPSIYASIA